MTKRLPIRIPMALCLALLLLAGGSALLMASESPLLELGSPFLDHAVLQRDLPVPVWGWANSGSQVTVSFAGQTKTVTADSRGKWRLELDPLKASAAGRAVTVACSNGETLTVQDVLVGEVWFASGQSNMDWIAGKSMCRDLANTLQRTQDEYPIREFNADIGSALFLRSRVTSADGWKTSRGAGGFSALALAFAAELYAELNIPIGIVRSTHGATPIETWTPCEGFASRPELQDIATEIRQSDPTTAESEAAYAAFFAELKTWQVESEKLINRGGSALPRPALPGIADQWKGATRMYNFKIAPLVPYAIRGVLWCQGTHNANDGKIYAAKMQALLNGLRENWKRPDLPFYFTQMQCYGQPDPDNVGFADIREAQRLFFMNAKGVGMVPQYDLNPANPGAIHYTNKLDPGKRLARWALAHQYGKNIAYSGPIYKSHSIEGNQVRVRFEQRGPGGGLMIGSKGEPSTPDYVEPAQQTPGESLKHFRLAGEDHVWHAAEAVIDGNEVVVHSAAVPKPVGVQYAYSASPISANLYNRAGLPATPFAYFEGHQLFQEDTPEAIAAAQARKEAEDNPPPPEPYLQVMSLYRDRAVIQRDAFVPVWGFALPGTEVTVHYGDQTKKAVAGEFEQWTVHLDPVPATTVERDLTVTCSNGPAKTVRDIVVGDVWVLTGTSRITGEVSLSRDPDAERPQPIPLLREFRLKTKARRFRTPRKRRLEVGGDFRYQAFWRPAVFEEPHLDTTTAAYYFGAQVAEPRVPLGVISLGAENPPLTWVSYESLQTAAGFEAERDELNLAYPNTEACKIAVVEYTETLKQYNRQVTSLLQAGKELPDELAMSPPAFPQPFYDQWASRTETATHTYNFCVSPLTPFPVRGVVWIPGENNIGEDVSKYAAALEAYAASLANTYGQDEVTFLYAQPTSELVPGIGQPAIKDSRKLDFDEWPKSLQEIASGLGGLAKSK